MEEGGGRDCKRINPGPPMLVKAGGEKGKVRKKTITKVGGERDGRRDGLKNKALGPSKGSSTVLNRT